MDFPLTVAALLERAGGTFSNVEIVTRRPDRSLVAIHMGRFVPALAAVGERADESRPAARRPRGYAPVESNRAHGGVFRRADRGRRVAHFEFAPASRRTFLHCKPCGRPFSDRRRRVAAHLREISRPREIRARHRCAIRRRRRLLPVATGTRNCWRARAKSSPTRRLDEE